MKLNLNLCWILLLAISILPTTTFGQEDRQLKALPEGTIRFDKFTGQPWGDIIDMYAKQAGLELDKVEPPPSGTFEFQGNRDMSYLEALDFLNEKLIPRERILIRKRHMLYLFSLGDEGGIPTEMIQTVSPDELDARGKYEILECQFDVKGLEASEIRNQIEPLIDDKFRRKMTVVPYANLLMIQETGGRLRFIRDNIVNSAKANADNWEAEYITLKHALPDDIMKAAENLGVDPSTGRDEDGTLSITVHPHGDKLLLMGDPAKTGRVKKLVQAIDVEFPENDQEIPTPYYSSYRVEGNVELIHNVLQSIMSGRDIKLDFDESTNRIHLFGRKEDHDDVKEVIVKTGSGSSNFSVVQIDIMDIEEAREKIEEAFGLGLAEAPEDAPTITELPPNRLVIRGNPGIVSEIEQMLEQIDMPFSREPGTRSTRRDISMSPAESDRIMGMLGDVLPSTGISNQIDVVMPGEQKWKFNRKARAFEIHRGEELMREIEEGMPAIPETQDREKSKDVPQEKVENSGTGNQVPKNSTKKEGASINKSSSLRSLKYTLQSLQSTVRQATTEFSGAVYVSTRPFQQEQENAKNPAPAKTPAPVENAVGGDEVVSEPGAPITLYVNDRGITILTKDLEAGDILEDLIMDELSNTLGFESMKLFLLRYREAADAKAQLESYLGMGSGGGGGGGMGDMMGNFMKNALPGGAGGMADALLGGGGGASGGGAVRELMGDVTIVADAKQYSLLISAMPEDMELIEQLLDLIDQPTAIQNPNPNGNTYLIKIRYMDLGTLEEMVRSNLAAVLKGSEDAGGQSRGGGSAEQRMQQQMLKAIVGGGGGGGGADQEAPKAALSVDARNNMLVVTGPQFIATLVEEFVALVDRPVEAIPSRSELLPVPDIDIQLLAEILQAQNPNIVVMADEAGGQSGASSQRQAGSSAGGRGSSGGNATMNNEAFRNAIMQGMRARGRSGSSGRGGGSGRGGSSSGRGGRGGR